MEDEFDSWATYVPIGDADIKQLVGEHIKFVEGEDCQLIGINTEDLIEVCDGDIKFTLCSHGVDYDGVSIWLHESQDMYLIVKDELNYIICNYQNSGYYLDENKITFTGWDDNIIVNLDTMNFKIQNVR